MSRHSKAVVLYLILKLEVHRVRRCVESGGEQGEAESHKHLFLFFHLHGLGFLEKLGPFFILELATHAHTHTHPCTHTLWKSREINGRSSCFRLSPCFTTR